MHNKTNPPPSSELWSSHEFVASPVELEAKKLLIAAGTSEMAKHAIDLAAREAPESADKAESLAKAIGFRSYRTLLESSTPGPKIDERQWFVTSICPSEWILWNDRDHEVAGVFESSSEASAAGT